jgi:predicted dienelactone hydrolase
VSPKNINLFLLVLPIMMVASSGNAAPPAGKVGFEQRKLPDGTELGIWYPASGVTKQHRLELYEQSVISGAPLQGKRRALIVMSHGSGGSYAGHLDTASELARAGFVVAALTHPGDNWRDRSLTTDVMRRPKALNALVGYMLHEWPSHKQIDAKRIGAFGFSAGGFTVLVAAGGQPDLSRLSSHCAAHPEFYDCKLGRTSDQVIPSTWAGQKNSRIKAIVVAAPALGFTFGKAELAGVKIPVQLWRAGEDRILPAPFYADAVKAALSTNTEFHDVPHADHFDFLAPCNDPKIAPQICTSSDGFDRKAFHVRFNQDVVRFFRKHLGQ